DAELQAASLPVPADGGSVCSSGTEIFRAHDPLPPNPCFCPSNLQSTRLSTQGEKLRKTMKRIKCNVRLIPRAYFVCQRKIMKNYEGGMKPTPLPPSGHSPWFAVVQMTLALASQNDSAQTLRRAIHLILTPTCETKR